MLLMSITLFVIFFVIYFLTSASFIREEAKENAENLFNVMTVKLDATIDGLKKAPLSSAWLISKRVPGQDSILTLSKLPVSNNSNIFGSSIAFEPNVYIGQEHCAYYTYSKEGEIISERLSQSNNYHSKEWYKETKKRRKPTWSNPYIDKGESEELMMSFSVPIFKSDSTFIGVTSIDLTLEWFQSIITEINPYKDGSIYFINSKGNYFPLVSNQKDNNSLSGLVSGLDLQYGENRADLDFVGSDDCYIDGVKSTIFYKHTQFNDWSLAIVRSYNSVYARLQIEKYFVILMCIIQLLLLVIFSYSIIHKLTKHITDFAEAAKNIAKGDFNTPLPIIKSHDELEQLSISFKDMQGALKEYIANLKSITRAKEQIDSQLKIASKIQLEMVPQTFPPFPEIKELDIFATLLPAKEIGGDLYDFFMMGDKLYFAIGDVSGKGVPAALFMSKTISLFHSIAKDYSSPARILNKLNKDISDSNASSFFVTFFVGILDIQTKVVRFSSAGHNAPIIRGDKRAHFLKIESNIPLGILDSFDFTEESYQLKDRESIILYTDGVTEAENVKNELFGDDNLLKSIAHSSATNSQLLTVDLLDKLKQFTVNSEQSDDITILIVNI